MSETASRPEDGSVHERLRREHGLQVDARVDLDRGAGAAPSGVLKRLESHPTDGTRYSVDDEIARGGMGAILRVWDGDLRRHLAMKVAVEPGRSGSGTPASELDPHMLARFLEEAQVTGQLEHPGIVPVHELGIDGSGQVYFTMRLVRGRTLEEVFDDARAERDDWTTTRALGVLQKVCEAMAYAHSREVLHRDLKPANVMVGEFGEVYVMDWGLARVRGSAGRAASGRVAVDPREGSAGSADSSDLYTMDGDVIGTPSYMAPEQARGEVSDMDARADVYAVGAMLYRLLAGCAPYASDGESRSPFDVLHDLRSGPPAPLDRAAPEAPAELVAICERAMERERGARYPDMAALSGDLRAFLEQRVVAAYETGAWAETRKWLARNRPLAASLAAGLTALVAGLAVSLFLMGRAEASATEAARQARISDEVNRFLNDDLLASIAPEQEGVDVTVREALDAAAARLDGRFPDEPRVEAELRTTIGTAYGHLGAYRAALPQLERAHELSLDAADATTEDRLAVSRQLANVTRSLGDYRSAMEQLDGLLEVAREELGDEDEATLALRGDRAVLLADLGQLQDAYLEYADVLEAMVRTKGAAHEDTMEARGEHAGLLARVGDYDGAVGLLREVVEHRRRTYGDVDPRTLRTIHSLALYLSQAGHFDEAEALHIEMLASARDVFGDEHPGVGEGHLNLGVLYLRADRPDDAEQPLGRALELVGGALGDDHPTTLQVRSAIATMRSDQGRLDEALAIREGVLAAQRRVAGPRHPSTLLSINNLGVLQRKRGDADAALETHMEVLELYDEVFGPEHPRTLIALENLGGVLYALGRDDECLDITIDVLERRRRVLGEDHPAVAKTTFNMAMLVKRSAPPDEALAAFEDALELLRAAFGPDASLVASCLEQLGNAALAAGDTEGARQRYAECLDVRRGLEGDERVEGYLLHQLARCHHDTGGLDEAIRCGEEALELRREVLGTQDESTLSTMHQLGLHLQRAERFAEGEELLLEVHDHIAEMFGAEHPNAARIRGEIALLYEAWGRPEEAEGWRGGR
ncbi:MAG: tetratricopeptide repeat protein [Planctomycetota bacterium]